jgi:hypothetical protein
MTMSAVRADDSVEVAAEKIGADVERGARKINAAVREGAAAVDDALTPSFSTSVCNAARAIGDDPGDTPAIVHELLREHPVAGAVTMIATAIVVHRVWARLSGR